MFGEAFFQSKCVDCRSGRCFKRLYWSPPFSRWLACINRLFSGKVSIARLFSSCLEKMFSISKCVDLPLKRSDVVWYWCALSKEEYLSSLRQLFLKQYVSSNFSQNVWRSFFESNCVYCRKGGSLKSFYWSTRLCRSLVYIKRRFFEKRLS